MNRNRLITLLFVAAIAAVAVGLIVGSAAAQSGNPPRSPDAPSAALGTAFTYQGVLKKSGAPISGACDFRFTLWDAASSGAQQGVTQTLTSLSVVSGLFTTQLDFGNQFTGEARWLQTDVKCAGDSGFTTLTPRQPLTATPYALGLRPGTSVNGSITSTAIIQTINTSGIGLQGSGGIRAGVLGTTTDLNGSGVEGNADGSNAAGVYGVNTAGPGVWGRNTNGGGGRSGSAVYGESDEGTGIFGSGITGVYGESSVGQGVYGLGTTAAGVGIYGGAINGGYAGEFGGRVRIFGDLNVFGTLAKSAGAFKIDHPLDPANKYLYHSFVESPDMKNIYDGVVTTDAHGNATVVLPDYFEALNKDFRYQLTVIGQFAQAIVSSEIKENRFSIKTDKPNVKISWQVTGIRHDPYAEANRIPIEEMKSDRERGQYIHPELYGQPQSSSISSLIPAGATPDANTPPSKPINPQSGGQ